MIPETPDFFEYIERILAAEGGLNEHVDGGLVCLLTPSLSERLGVGEEWEIAGSSLGGYSLGLEASTLDGLIALGRVGGVGQVELKELSSRSGGLHGELMERVELIDGIGEIGRVSVATGSYLSLLFRMEARSGDLEDKGLLSFSCNEESLIETPWLLGALKQKVVKDTAFVHLRTPIEKLWSWIQKILEPKIMDEMRVFSERITFHRSNKRRQYERIHRRERKEIVSRMQISKEEEQLDLLEQLAESEAIYLDKITQIPLESPLDVRCDPVAGVHLMMPVSRVEYHVKRRKKNRTISWTWNPLIERFESRACESCARPIFQIVVNDQMELCCASCAGL